MAALRSASVSWDGDLASGSGVTSGVSSGVFSLLPVSWASRTEAPEDRTSPEELLAAAHASCYAMALSNVLAKAGNPPEKLETSATVAFQAGEGIVKGVLTVRGTVPGIDPGAFEAAAGDAKENCPVSQALKGNVELTLDAALA